jgi:lysophospholipase L1-like esterase
MGEIISQDVSNRLKRSLGHYTDLNSLTTQLNEKATKEDAEQNPKTVAYYNRAIDSLSVPKNGLSRALTAIQSGVLKVAIVGDSITEGADQIDANDAYAKRLEKVLKEQLPGVTITFQNFALGSRRLNQFIDVNYKGLASEPTDTNTGFYRTWSTVGKAWKDHVKDFAPDLFIIAFGMNDSYGYGSDKDEYNNLTTLWNDVQTWLTIPNVVLVPTILPTTVTGRYFQRNDVTNAVARATRIFGKNKGVYIADANRLYQILRDGKDEVARGSNAENNWEGYTTGLWTGETDRFNVSGVILTPNNTSGSITRSKSFYNGSIELDVSFNSTNTVNRIYYRKIDGDNDLGYFFLQMVGGATNGWLGLYKVVNGVQTELHTEYNLVMPTENNFYRIKIEVNDNSHKIYLQYGFFFEVEVNELFHDGGIQLETLNDASTMRNLTLNYSEPLTGAPLFTEDDLLGKYQNYGHSGNGINHPSGEGHALFYLPAFNNMIRKLTN